MCVCMNLCGYVCVPYFAYCYRDGEPGAKEDGVGVGSQRHGETAEDAKKREMREKKAEVQPTQKHRTPICVEPLSSYKTDMTSGAGHCMGKDCLTKLPFGHEPKNEI